MFTPVRRFCCMLLLLLPFVNGGSSAVTSADWKDSQDFCPVYVQLYIDDLTVKEYLDKEERSDNPFRIDAVMNGSVVASTSQILQVDGRDETLLILRVPGTESDIGKEITFIVVNTERGDEYLQEISVEFSLTSIGQPSQPVVLHIETPVYIEPEWIEVTIDEHYMMMTIGDELDLSDKYKVFPEGAGQPYEIGWSSDDEQVVQIKDGNKAVAVGTGMTNVTVTLTLPDDRMFSDLFSVQVFSHVEGIEISQDEYEMYTGWTVRPSSELLWQVYPQDALDQTIRWVSSDESVLKYVDGDQSDPEFKAIHSGECYLTAITNDGDFEASVRIIVISQLEGIEFIDDTIYLEVGRSMDLVPEMLKAAPQDAEFEVSMWNTDGWQIEVTDNTLTAIEPGAANLYVSVTDVTQGIYEAMAVVIVTVPIEEFEILREKANIYLCDSLDMTNFSTYYRIGPEGANQTVFLESSNPDVLAVRHDSKKNQYLKPLKTGKATVTVNTTDPSFYGSVEFEVLQPLESISFDRDSYLLDGRAEVMMEITFSPENAVVTWDQFSYYINRTDGMSDDWSILSVGKPTVNDNGLSYPMSAVTAGKCSVTILWRGEEIGSVEVETGMAIDLKDGWSWMSVPQADRLDTESSIKETLGNILVEARTSDALWVNDPEWGIVGTGKTMSGQFVKMYLEETGEQPRQYISFYGLKREREQYLSVESGWNWLFNPYEFDHDLDDLESFAAWAFNLEPGSMIVSKANGFATVNENGEWEGTLKTLETGQGYMLFNNGESLSLIWPDETMIGIPSDDEEDDDEPKPVISRIRTRGAQVQQIDDSRFADNMCITAMVTDRADNIFIEAYVGNELRGIGVPVNGRHYIQVHGNIGETVRFIATDIVTGRMTVMANRLEFAPAVGTLLEPLQLEIRSADGLEDVYDAQGRRVNPEDIREGLFIIKGVKTLIRR